MTEFDNEELKKLLFGRFDVRKCPACDCNGDQWFDGRTGLGVSPTPPDIDEEWIASELCTECDGLAYLYKFHD